jgi:ATP-binding cassette subfamily A (ABC1) protein 3
MLGSHLKALIEKNFLVSKSTIILTLVEILSPIVLMLGLLGLKSLFKKNYLEIQEDKRYVANNSSVLENALHPYEEDEVAYRGSLYMCEERNIIAFVGEDFPSRLAAKFIRHSWERGNLKFKYYRDYKTLSDYVESEEYGIKDGKICFAVSFQKSENKYTYKLHYYASPYNKDKPPRIPSTEIGVGDRLNKQPDYKSHFKYTQSGFYMVQKFFYDYVLQEETNNSRAEIRAILCPKKYSEYINDPFAKNLEMLLGFFTIIAYAIPMSINIYRNVKEKESKVKEGMKIMGLSELTYFFSDFITYLIKNVIYSVFINCKFINLFFDVCFLHYSLSKLNKYTS